MTDYQGSLRKMAASLPANSDDAVLYSMVLDEQVIGLNSYLGQDISLTYTGGIHCIHCQRKTNKSFSQGYCYPCFKSLPQCDLCIMSPEKCHYQAGTCRDEQWADEFCMQDHYVYLANSSALKVGITRGTQIPTRWIDQGAVQALPIFRVKQRRYAGLVEVLFKQHMADKTNWRAMLKGNPDLLDLAAIIAQTLPEVAEGIAALQSEYGIDAVQFCDQAEAVEIQFPVLEFPDKVTSLNFDKTPQISGRLMGIKGQYLLLDTGVLNLRKFTGYQIQFSV